ncbi:MAG TPA: FecR family protein [Candidatus Omnitrophota bacterium]|nr:FecR family protein [Candidatus Omnitrophota bacterium]HPS37182.1 FecR family protein [Candidatus Omnitrophota bacterium]
MRKCFAVLLTVVLCLLAITASLHAEVAPVAESSNTGELKTGRIAEINSTEGTVLFRKNGTEDWKTATKGMLLVENDEIKTGENSKAEILLDKGGETGKLNLAANTQLRLETMKQDPVSGDKTTLLDLALGRVLVKAEKFGGNSSFQVKTPTSICAVRGTVFEVTVEASDAPRIPEKPVDSGKN